MYRYVRKARGTGIQLKVEAAARSAVHFERDARKSSEGVAQLHQAQTDAAAAQRAPGDDADDA